MKTSEKGIQLIKQFEGLHDGDLKQIGLQPKMCPAGFWTEGYGSLVLDANGNSLRGESKKSLAYKFSKVKTEADAEELLKKDLIQRENMINSLELDINQYQFDALVSFCYNVGFENLKRSTLLKKIKANPNAPGIHSEFLRWNKANGIVLNGLTRRREAEANLYTTQI